MSNNNDCNCKQPSTSKRCLCKEDLNEPPRKHVAVLGVSGADVARVDMQGRTALHRAARRGDVDRVKELLAEGYSPLHLDHYGWTPLLIAVFEIHEAVAELLIETDSGLNIADDEGWTPLHIAAHYGCEGLVRKLLMYDVNPHLEDTNGVYPLQRALNQSYFDIAKRILRLCAWLDLSLDFKEMELPPYQTQFCVEVLSECYLEIKAMKEVKIEGSNVTFYEIATEHVEKVARYLENETIRTVLNSPFENFPNYSDLLTIKVQQAEAKKKLSDDFANCFALLATRKRPFLLAACAEAISFYLSESEMHNFVTAIKFSK